MVCLNFEQNIISNWYDIYPQNIKYYKIFFKFIFRIVNSFSNKHKAHIDITINKLKGELTWKNVGLFMCSCDRP